MIDPHARDQINRDLQGQFCIAATNSNFQIAIWLILRLRSSPSYSSASHFL
jgi:hypothetical protein